MNLLLAVIIPPNIDSPEDWVAEQMAPFDFNLKVRRYKDYLSQAEVDYLMEYHDFLTHFELLMKKNERKEIFFEDEKGIYQYSEHNTAWKWNKWGIGGKRKFEEFKTPLKFPQSSWDEHAIVLTDLEGFHFSCLLTPQGEWQDCHEFGWSQFNADFKPSKNDEAWSEWLKHINSSMREYQDHVALSIVIEC